MADERSKREECMKELRDVDPGAWLALSSKKVRAKMREKYAATQGIDPSLRVFFEEKHDYGASLQIAVANILSC